MGFKPFSDLDHESGKLFQRDCGGVYEVIGYITRPAVILRDIRTDAQHTVVIDAPIAKEYRRLEPGAD